MRLSIKFVACALFLLGMGLSVAAGSQDFTLVNKTGLTITALHVSPAADNHWGEDVLGVDVLENGKDCEIKFSWPEDECKWDLKIIDEEGDAVVWSNINLCKTSKVTLHYENKQPTADLE